MAGQVSWRVRHVWGRNLHVFLRTWKVSFLPPIFDSLFFLLALGYGLGQFVAGDRRRRVRPLRRARDRRDRDHERLVLRDHVRLVRPDVLPEDLRRPDRDPGHDRGGDRRRDPLGCDQVRDLHRAGPAHPRALRRGEPAVLPAPAAARPPRRSPLRRDRALLHGVDPVDRHPQLPVVPLHHADDGPLGHLLPAREPAAPGPVRRVRDPAAHARRLARPCPDPAGRRAASPSSASSGWSSRPR